MVYVIVNYLLIAEDAPGQINIMASEVLLDEQVKTPFHFKMLQFSVVTLTKRKPSSLDRTWGMVFHIKR